MNRQQAKELVQRYNQGLATAEERDLLENWYLHKSDSLSLEEDEIDFNRVDATLRLATFTYAGLKLHSDAPQIKRIKLWPRIAAVASIVVVLAAGLFYYANTTNSRSGRLNLSTSNDIAPGSNKAVLTLADGKQLILTGAKNGALANEQDARIKKTADGQLVYEGTTETQAAALYNTITTPRGGQYTIMLSDGTKVILNAASSLKYPTAFKGKDRTVTLTGEGYFEVAHNKAKPFKVINNGQTVEVLGTHFNINSYTDEPNIKTTLLEGSVNVNGTLIKPNQQALVGGSQLIVKEVNAADAVAWKDGVFKFDHTDMKTSMRQIARWYDVEVVYEGNVENEQFYGKIDRSYTLSEVLKVLELSNVHFKIEGKKIIVSP
ncbi:FecR family protein [Pedobacter sp. BAL39]|uniref:FecR family protein n=1 Tax=Pedobacter sp. BAL39 TaxID=391596 RepID=UPI0005871E07|nr:FecR domain-containing protein [Pedobacter sp. BAL39]